MSKRHRLLLAAAASDKTFAKTVLDGANVWVGKCIHCNAKLVLAADGSALGEATLEHIQPQARGGTDELRNLAIACARCNTEKGIRHDHKRGERLDDVMATLRARRDERWRDPAEVGVRVPDER